MQSKYPIILIVLITLLVAAAGPASACDLTEPDDPSLDGHAFEPDPETLPTTDSSDTQTLSTTATDTSNGEFEVHILNVGQADAAVIFSPEGETMVIDSGHWTDDGGTIIEFLEKHDVDHIDHLVATHAHSDHIGGHADLIEHFEEEKNGIGAAYDSGVPTSTNTYEDYMDAVEEYDVTLYEVEEGDELPFDGLEANVFNPPTDDPEYDYDESELHYNSMTILFEHEETSFLFTGDAEYHAEERMADTYGDELEATVYHAGHHGSSTSSNDHFLEVIDTQVTTISSNYDSQFGHPDNETLDRLDAYGVNAYWTGTHGTNSFVSDGEEFTIYAQNDASTDPMELRDDDESTLDPNLEPKKVGTVSDEEFQGTTHQETLDIDNDDPETNAEHTWTLTDAANDFDGEVDSISVEYPTGTSLDDIDADDVTVLLDRDGDGSTDEISVNQDDYEGDVATFDLSGMFNTSVEGEIQVGIDGVENPSDGVSEPTITLEGDDTHMETTELAVA
ncbi:competence protein [Natronococcus pandeyae]|uniref:Competence protein n=1 Tax=Natronococcus pandeyae TaxID=2055836 RepID=A0A8J8TPU9_9EURY|nr:MBL fold metallo-hydrolase [Natronococcus pandeyae]TYL35857.1 competence protein [Natronococcus pandeyae]